MPVVKTTMSPDDHIRQALAILNARTSRPDLLVKWLDGTIASSAYQAACLVVWHQYVAQFVVAWHNTDMEPDVADARMVIFDRASDVADRKAAAVYMVASINDDGASERQIALRNVYHGYAAQVVTAWHAKTNTRVTCDALDGAVVDRIAAEEDAAARYAADLAAIAAVKAADAIAFRVALKAEIEAGVSDVVSLGVEGSKGANSTSDSGGSFIGDGAALQAAINAAPPGTTVRMLVRRGDNGLFNLQVGTYSSNRTIRLMDSSNTNVKLLDWVCARLDRLNGHRCESMTPAELRETFTRAQQVVCVECWIPYKTWRLDKLEWLKKM